MESFRFWPQDRYLLETFKIWGDLKIFPQEVQTGNFFLKSLLGLTSGFPTSYLQIPSPDTSKSLPLDVDQPFLLSGNIIDPRAISGVRLLAGKLGDRYDLEKNRLSRWKSLPQDYFTLISQEALKGRYLIAFDKSWVIPGLRDWFNVYSDGFSEDKITIYRFGTQLAIFSSVSSREMEHITTWLYQNRLLFDDRVGLTIFDYDKSEILDFSLLFPVELSFFGDLCLVESKILTQTQLESAWYEDKMTYTITGLNPLQATYAVYLASENTNFQYPMTWSDDQLNIWSAGYLGSENLQNEFLRVLEQIIGSGLIFRKAEDSSTGRIFYCQDWYLVDSDFEYIIPESIDPIRITDFSKLGYSVSPESELLDPISVGYDTLTDQINITTFYYYRSTSGRRIDFLEMPGSHDPQILQQLEILLRLGYFLSPRSKGILKLYPGILTCDPCVIRPFGNREELESTLNSLVNLEKAKTG